MSAETRVWVADRWVATRTKAKTANYGKGDRWRVVWRDPESKKEKSRQFAKKVDAEAFRTKTEDSLREGIYVAPEITGMTFSAASSSWFASKKMPKVSSLAKYRGSADNYVLPRWGSTPLSKITRPLIDSWVTELEAGNAVRREGMVATGKLSPATIRAVLKPFTATLHYAVAQGWLTKNPATGVELPRIENDAVVYLSHVELEYLIRTASATATPQDARMIATLGFTGLRPGELVALDVSDVDLKARRIHVRRTMTTDANGKPVMGTTTKTPSGARDVPVPPHLVSDLKKQIGERVGSVPLFITSTGSRISQANWNSRVWNKVTAKAETPAGFTPKGLRHTAASLAISAGADVLVVQRMLGHADATETLNTYAKLFPDRLDEVSAAVTKARTKALTKAKKKAKSPDSS